MKNTHLHIRIDEVLKKQIEESAKKENRTISNFIETLYKEYKVKEGD